ncbi:hypothetical protein UPYG_G00040830 [Umbra pygmaea]|uniref:Uncharacterized protein n=1 Tax=Umbra pygmaea TaxID=75934 RepID=A0ABD0XQ12_UMBPY
MGKTSLKDQKKEKAGKSFLPTGPTPAKESFTWEEYLVETSSMPAPPNFFRQSRVPPSNDFKVGMKLEARILEILPLCTYLLIEHNKFNALCVSNLDRVA